MRDDMDLMSVSAIRVKGNRKWLPSKRATKRLDVLIWVVRRCIVGKVREPLSICAAVHVTERIPAVLGEEGGKPLPDDVCPAIDS